MEIKNHMTGDEWNRILSILRQIFHIVAVGILDDVDPKGGADTACQQGFENAARQGQVVSVTRQLFPGVTRVQNYRIFPK